MVFSVKKLAKFSIITLISGLILTSALYLNMRDSLPSVEVLKDLKWQTPMQIYSADGKLISQFGEKNVSL